MTREEIEKILVSKPYRFESYFEKIQYDVDCIDGLKASDAEPNLESLWHDTCEEPLLEETKIIFLNEQGFAYISERFGATFSYNLEDYSQQSYVNLLNIRKWAYISDLLPKGGD